MRPSLQTFLLRSLALSILAFSAVEASAADPLDGVAIAIVYDTSGSMLEQVKDSTGNSIPKYQIANRALSAVASKLQTYAAASAESTPRLIQTGLVIFDGDSAKLAIKFGPLDANALQNWAKAFSKPQGATPLGEAVRVAGQAALASNLSRKHVLVITDGINTRGPDPAAIIPRLANEAARKNSSLFFHFVAFDVDANVFAPVKKLGATVLGAANEQQLNTQLEFILEEKILLEAEGPPSAKDKKK